MTRGDVALLTCGVCAPLGIYVDKPILPLLPEGFGVAPGRAGLAVGAPLVGSVSDRLGHKPLSVAALVLITVSTLRAAAAAAARLDRSVSIGRARKPVANAVPGACRRTIDP